MTEILAFPSQSSRNKNDGDLTIAIDKWEDNSYIRYNGHNFYGNFNYHFSSLFLLPLDRRYQRRSTCMSDYLSNNVQCPMYITTLQKLIDFLIIGFSSFCSV